MKRSEDCPDTFLSVSYAQWQGSTPRRHVEGVTSYLFPPCNNRLRNPRTCSGNYLSVMLHTHTHPKKSLLTNTKTWRSSETSRISKISTYELSFWGEKINGNKLKVPLRQSQLITPISFPLFLDISSLPPPSHSSIPLDEESFQLESGGGW